MNRKNRMNYNVILVITQFSNDIDLYKIIQTAYFCSIKIARLWT